MHVRRGLPGDRLYVRSVSLIQPLAAELGHRRTRVSAQDRERAMGNLPRPARRRAAVSPAGCASCTALPATDVRMPPHWRGA